jgi:GNAT superfamily N-acetyltransferase
MDSLLRLASESDADLLLALMREYYAFDGHHFDPVHARRALIDLLREPAFGLAWLILDQAAVVGYIVLCFGYSLEYLGRDAFLDEFYLKQSHRRRGLGTKVLREVEAGARASGVQAIHLEVVRRNQAAGDFYRKMGFVDHEHHLMTKRLGPGK